ncbi:MAG: signal peptidase I [Cellulosilyticaceae bacterium]
MKRNESRSFKKQLVNFGIDLLIALAVVLLINQFIVQNQRVEGNSMAPTMKNGDMVLMNKWIYHFIEPQVGDIIGFYAEGLNGKVVKRILGVPGDVIDFKNNMIYRNEQPILQDDSYGIFNKGDRKYPYTVPEGTYFVIGDNYNQSIDSRYHYIGDVPEEAICGRISLRLWPFGINPVLK